jgi:ring-1,2-phenylacetyl-CoA epoxidase subunit PaaC
MLDQSTIDYTLHLADNALVLGHRNSEWTGHGPILEQDIALSNIALDLIGQARNFYQYVARQVSGRSDGRRPEVTEDTLAYLRDSWDFKNCLLVEQVNGDWAKTILRQFFFSAYQFYFYQSLRQSQDRELAAIAEKSYKEVTYHLRWSSEWVIRLGDGTAESHTRMKGALEQLWKFTGELFVPADYERTLTAKGVAVDVTGLRWLWEERVNDVFQQAQLVIPAAGWEQTGGKSGRHTEHLGYLLAEMQFLQRAYPGCEW